MGKNAKLKIQKSLRGKRTEGKSRQQDLTHGNAVSLNNPVELMKIR